MGIGSEGGVELGVGCWVEGWATHFKRCVRPVSAHDGCQLRRAVTARVANWHRAE